MRSKVGKPQLIFITLVLSRQCFVISEDTHSSDNSTACSSPSPNGLFCNSTIEPIHITLEISKQGCGNWTLCDQLCTLTSNGHQCDCAEGFTLVNGSECIAKNGEHSKIIFLKENSIVNIEAEDLQFDSTILANVTSGRGLDFNYRENILFWSDLEEKKIYSQQLRKNETSEQTMSDVTITLPNSWVPVALSVDWLGNKLYVLDSVGFKVDVFELDGKTNAVVLSSNLTAPSDLALDPTIGFMFIADTSQLLRANMDGTNIKLILTAPTLAIAVDIFSKRVYWCSWTRIMNTDYDGKDTRTVVRGEPLLSLTGFTLFENRIYWTDGKVMGVLPISKDPKNTTIQIFNKNKDRKNKPIKVVNPLLQPTIKENPCDPTNNSCDHMCILTNRGEKLGFRCACKLGWRLSENNRSCELVSEYLLYSNLRSIKGILLDRVEESFRDVILPIPAKKGLFRVIDFDARNRQIFYTDSKKDIVYRYNNKGNHEEIFATLRNESLEGVAVDWVSQNLYYVDGRNGTINIISTKNVSNSRTILEHLKPRPRAIVVHPNKGYVFFTQCEWYQSAHISRMFTDGTNLTVFDNLKLGLPKSLAIDFQTDRLYWCDDIWGHVQHSNLDGTDVKTITASMFGYAQLGGIAVHGKFIYVSVGFLELNSIIKFDKLTQEQVEIMVDESRYNRPQGVKVFSEAEQRIDDTHPCWKSNGGCEKFCFAIPKNNTGLFAQCGCSDDEKLAEDQKRCI